MNKPFTALLGFAALATSNILPLARAESPSREPVRVPMVPKVGKPRTQIDPQIKPKSGEILQQIAIDGRQRSYYLYLPTTVPRNRPMPVIIGLHGGRSTPRNFSLTTNFNRLAERQGFMVVYPTGIDRQWQDGRENFTSSQIDDVGFISGIIDDLKRKRSIDSRRIYAVGMSNGGMMAQRLACQMPDRLAAVASVAAAMPAPIADTCRRGKPISVVVIGAPSDRIVPWQGGNVARNAVGTILSVPQTIDLWRAKAGCQTNTRDRVEIERSRRTLMTVKVAAYRGCQSGIEVALVTIDGGGHTWPGGLGQPRILGATTTKFDATEFIWEFFSNARSSGLNSGLERKDVKVGTLTK